MSEQDNRQPIEPRHIGFMRAVVALARQHKMRNVSIDFYGGGTGEKWTKLHGQWSEGRHGDQGQIFLRAEARHHCPEIGPAGPCISSPDGEHHVDTSMESGCNNCFHCEQPMGGGR